MHYAISDIHGQLKALKLMLEKISYDSQKDFLYFLGDYVDWGEDSMGVIRYIMELQRESSHVYALLGNHDMMMRSSVKHKASMMPPFNRMNNWYYNRGQVTFNSFLELDKEEQKRIIEWLDARPVEMEILVDGKKYILAHSIPRCAVNPEIPLSEEELLKEAVWATGVKYEQLPLDGTLIRGHEITRSTRIEFWDNDVIDIDCGAKALCVLDDEEYKLACLCIENREEFYVKREEIEEDNK